MVLVDVNVHLDLTTRDPVWFQWSSSKISDCRSNGMLVINPIIYAEIANAFLKEEELDRYISPIDFVRQPLPWEAAYLAAQAFRAYRQRGGVKSSPMPDFYIGAHAYVAGLTLLTRDAARYQTYFPNVPLISP